MTKPKRRIRPNLKGCPICGSLRKKIISGFTFCIMCNHRYGESGLGRQTERRGSDGEFYNKADDRGKLPGADEQTKSPKPRDNGRRKEL